MKDKKIYCLMVVSLILMCLSTVIFATVPEQACEEIYSNTFRLHVIANSNSAADQSIKYKVRDRIVEKSNELFADCLNLEDALKVAEENKETLLRCAKEEIESNGIVYGANIDFGYELFPVKSYGPYTFPSGEYLSLRVVLGEGKGENWWCVLFPPLCVELAKDSSYSADTTKILTEKKYKVKFKLYQALQSLFS